MCSFRRLMKNPAPCFESLSMSGTPRRIPRVFPLTLGLSKGTVRLFQQPVRILIAVAALAMLLTACGDDDAGIRIAVNSPPQFAAAACEMPLPAGQDPARVDCG